MSHKYNHELADRLASEHGIARNTVIKCWREGRPVGGKSRTSIKRNAEISENLALLAAVSQGSWELSYQAIADICDCGRETIRDIELKALKKLRRIASSGVFDQ
jgi:hypothetical protein